MPTDPIEHYRRNEETYQNIDTALDAVRSQFVGADRETQKTMLFDSSVFAVMSVQNDVDILERAFRGYAHCDSLDDLQEVTRGLNYGGNKYDYIRDNTDTIQSDVGDRICQKLEHGLVWAAVEICVTELMGVSWIKAAFIPAMLGFKRVLCIDTNVAQMVDDESVQAEEYDSMDDYKDAVARIRWAFPSLSDECSTFMLQWVVFDANRGDGVEKHEEWFEHMLPATPFGRQTMIGSF
jgi:hypothetical protein